MLILYLEQNFFSLNICKKKYNNYSMILSINALTHIFHRFIIT